MRVSRFLPVLVAGAVFTATAAPASAATPGVGTTVGSLEVLSLDVGELLELDLLTDFAAANTDPDVDDAGAAAALKALVVDALVLPEPVELGVLDVSSDGEEKTATNEESAIPDTLAAVLAGDLLPASLVASLTEPGAMSTTTAGITELDILGGIAGIDATQLGIAANSLVEQADGSRRLVIDKLTVLELGDLLEGVGIPLDLLPLDLVLGLIDSLGLTDQLGAVLDGLGVPLDLTALDPVAILDAIEGLLVLEEGLASAGTDEGLVCEAVDGFLGDLPTLPTLPGGVLPGDLGTEEVCTAVDDILAALPIGTDVLDTVLALLADTALLELNALDVAIVTKATDSLETSAAEITATLGGINAAGLEIPEVDVAQAIATATAQLDDVLALIDPVLDDLGLLDIGLLEQDAGVTEEDDAIVSEASFTGLRVDVAGLTDDVLNGVLAGLTDIPGEPELGELPIGELLGDDVLAPITGLLGQTDALSALSDGLSLRVASLGQTSTFTEVLNNTATPTPAAPQLPQTGSNDALMLALAAIAAGGALGIRRVVRIKE